MIPWDVTRLDPSSRFAWNTLRGHDSRPVVRRYPWRLKLRTSWNRTPKDNQRNISIVGSWWGKMHFPASPGSFPFGSDHQDDQAVQPCETLLQLDVRWHTPE